MALRRDMHGETLGSHFSRGIHSTLLLLMCVIASTFATKAGAREVRVDDDNCRRIDPTVEAILWTGKHVSDESISVLQAYSFLLSIRLIENDSFDDVDLLKFARLAQVTTLEINSCKNLSAVGIDAFLDNSRLSDLRLDCSDVASTLFSTCKENTHILSLSLAWCGKLDDSTLARLPCFKSLRRLSLDHLSSVSAKSAVVLQTMKSLLNLSICQSTWCVDSVISQLPDAISHLWLFDAKSVTAKGLGRISKLQLKGFGISACDAVDNDFVKGLCASGKLERLSICECKNVDAGITSALHLLPNLGILELDDVPCVSGESSQAFTLRLRSLSSLRQLTFTRCPWVSDDIVLVVREMKHLRQLNLRKCNNLTPDGILSIREWAKETKVELIVE